MAGLTGTSPIIDGFWVAPDGCFAFLLGASGICAGFISGGGILSSNCAVHIFLVWVMFLERCGFMKKELQLFNGFIMFKKKNFNWNEKNVQKGFFTAQKHKK